MTRFLIRLPRRRPAPLACQELVELITEYLDGALPASERARFDAHLGGCPHCTAYLHQFQATIAATGRLQEADLAPAARAELLAVFAGWNAGR